MEMKMAANYINHVEFTRARNQLKSNLLINLESKAIQFEDIARYGRVWYGMVWYGFKLHIFASFYPTSQLL